MKKRKIIINTDLGDDVDDAAAIIMALHSPELEVIGITTVFKDTVKRAEMVLELCEKCGRRDIPVFVGFGSPLIERPDCKEAPIQYELLEKKKLISTELTAVDFIIQSVCEIPDLIIVEMGPMTNLALACYQEPEVMKLAKIIAMGGMFTQSAPEWNMKCDPEAARIVMDHVKYLTMFGLEITKHCVLEEQILQKICEKENEILTYFLKGARIFQEKTHYPLTLHDVLLIAYLVTPQIVGLKKADYTVELSGDLTRGGIVFEGNMYHLNAIADKEFYFAESFKKEEFQKLLIERLS